MKMKLLSKYHGQEAGAIVEVDETTSKFLLDGDLAVEYDEAKEKALESENAMTEKITNSVVKAFESVASKNINVHVPKAENKDMKMGEFLTKVMNFTASKDKAALGVNVTTAADGAVAVPENLAEQLWTPSWERGQLAKYCAKVTISQGNTYTWNEIDSDLQGDPDDTLPSAAWTSEAATIGATIPQFTKRTLELEKLAALFYSSEEALEDTRGLVDQIINRVPSFFAARIDEGIMRGTGTGQMTGLLDAANTALVSVAKDGSQTANTITLSNIGRMFAALTPGSASRAVWIVSPTAYGKILNLEDTNGNAVFLPGNVSGGPFGTLYGRPIVVSEYAKTLGDKGDVVLADLSEYLIATKGGMKMDSSMHVQFLTDQMAFRFIMRLNGKPMPSSAYTTMNDGSLSPFVTLDERA